MSTSVHITPNAHKIKVVYVQDNGTKTERILEANSAPLMTCVYKGQSLEIHEITES